MTKRFKHFTLGEAAMSTNNRKLIKRDTLPLEHHNYSTTGVDDLIGQLTALKAKFDKVELGHEYYYGDKEWVARVYSYETDEELQKRVDAAAKKAARDKENAAKSRKRKEANERKEYERLKKKFENE